MVADEATGQMIQAEVDLDRYTALDNWARGKAAELLGQPSDAMSYVGRRVAGRDAQEALAFLVSQLAYTEQGLFERYYRPTQYDKFLAGCIDYSAGEHAQTIEYEIYDRVGNAQDTDSAADDMPTVDVGYARKSFPVVHATVEYQFTQQELRTTAFLRRPLPERRLAAAMEAYQRKLNAVGLKGNSVKNITGLFNNASVTAANRPSGQTWSSSNTTAGIVSDVGTGLYQTWLGSAFQTVADTLLVPPSAFQYISTTPFNTANASNVTILQFLKQNNLCKDLTGRDLTIEPAYDADTAGSGSTGRAIFYKRDPQQLVMHIPMPLRFLAPQLEGVRVRVPGEFRYSGVEVRRPTGAYYMDGVQ
jgi:hypothetical protein